MSQVGTQSTARTKAHSGVKGERSHGGDLVGRTRGMTDCDGAYGGGYPCGAEEPMRPTDTNDSRFFIVTIQSTAKLEQSLQCNHKQLVQAKHPIGASFWDVFKHF
ncbi:hypothetical protein DPX16_16639 [Anabarilius grahami]|uniref:Uncharacterized protein n=1 Tax=Anabarilius grahami TaxID=495550 RepID=A0A3N0YS80_ANAGA|nr:hypothetical protein DPX16_16639 [Anabarilius grahami]